MGVAFLIIILVRGGWCWNVKNKFRTLIPRQASLAGVYQGEGGHGTGVKSIPGIRRPAVRSSYSLESIGTSKQLQPTRDPHCDSQQHIVYAPCFFSPSYI